MGNRSWITAGIVWLILTSCAFAAPAKPAAPAVNPAELLTTAKTEIGLNHSYKAEALLQQVIKAESASRAQVEEALILQSMIYYGDVFASALMLPSVVGVAQKPEPFGKKISERLLLASRAFHTDASKYLNITAGGSKLQSLKVSLPDFGESDVEKLQGTLSSKSAVQGMIDGYSENPAAGEGVYARASQFGLYLGLGGTLPKQKGRKLGDIQAKFRGGATFDQQRYLDWLASVSLDMAGQVRDTLPQYDLRDLSHRCDERLLKLAAADSQFAKNAKARLTKKAK